MHGEERLWAVRVYELFDCAAVTVINEPEYLSREMLMRWHRSWSEYDADALGYGHGEQ